MTTFNVTMDAASMEGKDVLVFLKPQKPQRNYRYHAWQVLTGSAGATETFEYDGAVSTDVSSDGEQSGNTIQSARVSAVPGQLFQAISPTGLSPKLELAPAALAREKLTPEECGVINKTTPFIQFDSNWYVSDHPVVTVPNLDANMICSFEHESIFYFMVASPPMVGQTYTDQDFSDMTRYVMPITASEVNVSLTEVNGLPVFDFSAK